MNVLYVSSGYPMIYQYLDRNIEKTLRKIYNTCILFQPGESLQRLQAILHDDDRPHLALILLGDHFSKQASDLLRKYGVKQAIWLTEDPYYMNKTLQNIHLYDYVFTIDSGAYKVYLTAGFPYVYHLPLGTDPIIFTRQKVDFSFQSDVLLVGYPYPSRVQLVEFLLKNGTFPITVIGKQWHNQLAKKFRRDDQLTIYDQWMEPEMVAKFYNGTKIVLNPHRQAHFSYKRDVINETINNRTFDIAACGAFQLIEDLPGLRSSFSEDEIIAYQDPSDCLAKVYFYLEKEELREKIASHAQKKVYLAHTFEHRIDMMKDIIELP
ncbi:CgeB family protein [Bacillus sp. SD088]|uniref:CgeB family protein n=1 Tax=Bacillus sp. SD088 TaxID=2782012 RepID=UPI001A978585|nr:glycosyltransferase [Bacillus sp. SD088]MBO0995700.1 glycosyltransferase [Bacillus sp. SD088]